MHTILVIFFTLQRWHFIRYILWSRTRFNLANKILTHTTDINNWQRGLPKFFFLSTYPHPLPHRVQSPVFKSNNPYYLSRHLCTALPTHRFFSSENYRHRNLVLTHYITLHYHDYICTRCKYQFTDPQLLCIHLVHHLLVQLLQHLIQKKKKLIKNISLFLSFST